MDDESIVWLAKSVTYFLERAATTARQLADGAHAMARGSAADGDREGFLKGMAIENGYRPIEYKILALFSELSSADASTLAYFGDEPLETVLEKSTKHLNEYFPIISGDEQI